MSTNVHHDLKDNYFIGVVKDNNDPLFAGRCRIHVFGITDNIPVEHLYWASPLNSTIFAGDGGGSMSVPKMGQVVRVQFNNGELTAPEYFSIQNIDTALIKKIQDDYQGTHVLLWDPDEELYVIFQKNSGFQIYYKESFMQISPDNMITIQHSNLDSVVELKGDTITVASKNKIVISAASQVNITADETIASGNQVTKVGPGPYYHAMLAEVVFPLLTTLATAIDAKMPITPGVNVGLVESAKAAGTSTNVLISQ
jgi:hypothetical protein